MIDLGKKNLLGVQIDAVDYDCVVERIICSAADREPLGVTALAVHGVMSGVLDVTHRHRLNTLELVVPDGQPVRWGLNLIHRTRLGERVYGPELVSRVCRQAASRGLSVYLFGSSSDVLCKLRERLQTQFPGLVVAGTMPSKFRTLSPQEKQSLVDVIHQSGATITLVGIGCPRQEVWAYEFKDALRMPVLAVGAAFSLHAGTTRQAPRLMQQAGVEWLFRLAMEPRRLWKRYALLNPLYLCLLFLQWSGWKRFDPHDTQPPQHDVLYG